MSFGSAIKALVVAATLSGCVRARITKEEEAYPWETFSFGPHPNGRRRHKRGFAHAQDVPSQDGMDPLYFVKMTDMPYTRKLASHPEGRDQRSRHVVEYVGHLKGKHRRLADTHGIEIMKSFVAVLNGFAARLSPQQVAALELDEEVISLVPNQFLDMATFESQQDLAVSEAGQAWAQGYVGENVVVGILDTGIWPEHPSFADVPTPEFGNTGKEIPYGPVPDSFSGSECVLDHPSSVSDQRFECNNKLIAASCYAMSHSSGPGEICGGDGSQLNATLNFLSARDSHTHGTHVAGTAVGNYGVTATVDGKSVGTISGTSPRARLAVYKVCWELNEGDERGGCGTVDTAAAVEDAAIDGCDVINLSLGGAQSSLDILDEALFNAVGAGLAAVSSAGNSGSDANTVGFPAGTPWVTAVANVYKPSVGFKLAIFTVEIPISAQGDTYNALPQSGPVFTVEAFTGTLADAELACDPITADLTGKIAFVSRGDCTFSTKYTNVQNAGAKSIIVYNHSPGFVSMGFSETPKIPGLFMDQLPGLELLDLVVAGETTIAASAESRTESLVVNDSSSRGPYQGANREGTAPGIPLFPYKPDIAAPGTDILAASVPLNGNDFNYLTGTSMASPHTAGLFANLLQKHPDWSPAQLRSATMTTADPAGFRRAFDLQEAGPFEIGSGLVDGTKSLDPGLTYDISYFDYAAWLCSSPYNSFLTPSVCEFIDKGGMDIGPDVLNYPMFSVNHIFSEVTFSRTVKSVADSDKIIKFDAEVDAPPGTQVVVTPNTLSLRSGETATYSVTISYVDAIRGEWLFGSLTWVSERGKRFLRASDSRWGDWGNIPKFNRHPKEDSTYSVRSPIAVQFFDGIEVTRPEFLYTGFSETSGQLDLEITAATDYDVDITIYGLVRAKTVQLTANKTGNIFNTALFENTAADLVYVSSSTFNILTSNANDDLDLRLAEIDLVAQQATTRSVSGGTDSDEFASLSYPNGYGQESTFAAVPDVFSIDGTEITFITFFSTISKSTTGGAILNGPGRISVEEGMNTVSFSWSGLDENYVYDGLVVFSNSATGSVMDHVPIRLATFAA